MAFYLGCPLWGSKRWLGSLLPSKTPTSEFLSLYSQLFTTVEGNTSFYAMPDAARMGHWREQTPRSFRFCFKFPQTISHHFLHPALAAQTQEWIGCLHALKEQAGPTFLQFPSTFTAAHFGVLESYLRQWPKELRVAVEVRHPGWFVPHVEQQLNALLESYDVGRVLYDVRGLKQAHPRSQNLPGTHKQKPYHVPVRFVSTTDFVFVRYISHPDPEKNDPLFAEWIQHMVPWLQQGKDVYFFMHHIDDYYMPLLCRRLHEQLNAHFPLPPLPLPLVEKNKTLPVQTSLF